MLSPLRSPDLQSVYQASHRAVCWITDAPRPPELVDTVLLAGSDRGALNEANALDDILVNFVERMELPKITIECEPEVNASFEIAEKTMKAMYSKLYEKGYLEVIFAAEQA